MKLTNSVGREKWVEKISAAWRETVSSIFETGNLLEAAKAELPHGEWLKMIKDELPFGRNVAQRLMIVAENENLRNGAHAPYLPVSWMTLYELSKLTEEQFGNGIETKVINPRMERKDVLALRGIEPKKKEQVAPARPLKRTYEECLMIVEQAAFQTAFEYVEIDRLNEFVAELIEDIKGLAEEVARKRKGMSDEDHSTREPA